MADTVVTGAGQAGGRMTADRTLYPCCNCCTPADYRDFLYAPGGCQVPDRHTLPCLMCGQLRRDPPW